MTTPDDALSEKVERYLRQCAPHVAAREGAQLLAECLQSLRQRDDGREAVAHKQGCEALGGYGHGVGPCSCGAESPPTTRPGLLEAAERRFNMTNGPSIPWSLAEALYAGYSARHGTSQSLERLHERGGFGWEEIAFMWDEPRGKDKFRSAVNSAIRAATAKLPETREGEK